MAKGKMKKQLCFLTEGTFIPVKRKTKGGGHVHRKHK